MNAEYDPEKRLWKPGRRSFMFLFGSALVGATLPPETAEAFTVGSVWGHQWTSLKVGYALTLSGVYSIDPIMYTVTESFVVKGVEGSRIRLQRNPATIRRGLIPDRIDLKYAR